ncbi:hypothetical protein G5T42_03250 [Microbacterium sp. 4R-513]|uniref:hypothetical protein n=1 Tax=Microbacterium sp. 4R-513 TaxID=2567934 RepID=UPI0013E1849E|nr:hypothetical protein [Microbacterium sp. 4R-513]QIG38626.1 hypothetical protein G5T42_03250 [Microbacterium sp. 4R-513]
MSATTAPNRSAGDDRAAEAAAAVARHWVRWYSGLVGTEAAERRRAEIESDLWEQRAEARETGRRSVAVAGSIAWRVVGGVPDDLLWVRTQRLAMRGQRAERKASAMNPLGNTLARWWWVAGAAVLAAIFLSAGIDNLVGDYAPLPEAAAQCFTYLAILVAGIACSYKAPRTSAALVAMGSLPTVVAYWLPPLMIFGLAVAAGALFQVARCSAPGALARAGGALGGLLLGAAAIMPMLGLAPGAVTSPFVAFGIALIILGAGIALLVATRAPATRTVESVNAPTLVA